MSHCTADVMSKGDETAPTEQTLGTLNNTTATDERDSDFSDFESDEFEEDVYATKSIQHHATPVINNISHRRERVRELVATEVEYIRDLEILLKITSEETAKEKFAPLDWNILLGNISQVVEVAKRFLLEIKYMAHCKEHEMAVGKVFLDFVEELSQVYKVYCSSYNVEVLPLIRRYETEEEASTAMKKLSEELRNLKRHLLDLNCVLIKPVQRILKYPLYLEELVSSTPESHKDFRDLQTAKSAYQAAAKDINEYTRAMDLVHKYRGDSDPSVHRKMRKISFRSLAKKSFRITTKISQRLGVSEQTLNSDLDKLENEFRSIRKAAKTLVKRVTSLTESLRNRHSSEFIIAEILVDIFPEAPEASKVRIATYELFNKIFQQFDNEIQLRVLHPARQILMLCEGPANLIQKTHKIMLDYDMIQVKLQAALEPSRIALVVEESAGMRATYEALSNQLLSELPLFISESVLILTICVQSMVAAHMYLQGHLAKAYLRLTQEPGLAYITPEDAIEKATHQVELLYQLLPIDYQKKQSVKKKDVPVKKAEKVEPVEIRSKSQERGMEASSGRISISTDFFRSIPSISKGRSRRSYPVSANASTHQAPKESLRVSAHDYFKSWSPSVRHHHHKTYFTSVNNKSAKELKKVDLKKQYPSDVLYRVVEDYNAVEENELTLQSGKLVAVLKKKDPMGGDERWVVDDGERIGLVRPKFLKLDLNDEKVEESESSPSVLASSATPDFTSIFKATVTHSENLAPKSITYPEDYTDSSDEWDDPDNLDGEVKKDENREAANHTETEHFTCVSRPVEQEHYVALYNYIAADSSQIDLQNEQVVVAINTQYGDWWYVKDEHGNQGYVPASYLTRKL